MGNPRVGSGGAFGGPGGGFGGPRGGFLLSSLSSGKAPPEPTRGLVTTDWILFFSRSSRRIQAF